MTARCHVNPYVYDRQNLISNDRWRSTHGKIIIFFSTTVKEERMSFSRLNYDKDAYKQDLRESVGSGLYVLNTPITDCQACFPPDNHNTERMNSAICANQTLVDVSSELLGITRHNSKAPKEKYLPNSGFCSSVILKDCNAIHAEDTRLSNPPITLRGTGWNRWEWLCQDPQQNAFVPFDYNIANRIVAKDNHRPYIQRPIDQSAALPPENDNDGITTPYKASIKDNNALPSTTWKASNFFTSEYGM